MGKVHCLAPSFIKLEEHQLPAGWITERIDSICKLHQGGKLKLTKESDYISFGIPAFSAAGQDGYVEEAEFQGVEAVILSAIGANCGRCFFASGNWTTLANVQAIIPDNENIFAKYLYYRVNRDDYWVKSGSAQPFIKPQSIKNAWISFPKKMRVQQKIAAILTTIDTAIEKTESLIEKYRKIKTGLMNDLFTRGIGPDGKLRPLRSQAPELYKKTELGWIPKEWEVEKLGEFSDITSGITLSSKKKLVDYNIEVPYLRVANVQDGYLDLNEIKTIYVSNQVLDKLCLKNGDVLMNEGGDFDKLGRGTVWEGEIDYCIHQNHVFRVRPNQENLLPYFLAYYAESFRGKEYFIKSSKQSTNLASINSTQLNVFPITFPSINEQSKIIFSIEAVNKMISGFELELNKLQKQKAGLMQDLLTGKVEVTVPEEEAVHG